MSQHESKPRQRGLLELILPKTICVPLTQCLRQRSVLFHQDTRAQLIVRALELRQLLIGILKGFDLLNVGGELLEFGIFHETLPHHLLHVDILAVVQVQDDLVGHFELGHQMLSGIVHHTHHLFSLWQVPRVFCNDNHVTLLVQSTTARTAGHLHVLTRVQETMSTVRPCYLLDSMVDDCLCGHVDTHRKSLSSE
jgi:hypothetical protein